MTETWIVAFTPRPADLKKQWFDIFVRHRPKHQHVFALRYTPSVKAWSIAHWTQNGMTFEVMSRWQVANVIAQIMEHGMAYEVPRTPAKRKTPAFMVYCVSMVRHLLGLRCIAITPYQLHRHLERKGYKRTFEY